METNQQAGARRQRERRARIAAAALTNPDGRLCPSCGKPNLDSRHTNCAACRARTRNVRSEIVEKGLCCQCRQPSIYGVYCRACNDRRAHAALHRQQAQVLAPYRAILVLDQSTKHLGERLRQLAFHTLQLDLVSTEKQREALLAQRVLVTTHPNLYRLLAAKAHAAIIDVSELGEEDIPAAISRHTSKLRLVGKVHLLLKLKNDGEAHLEPLILSRVPIPAFADAPATSLWVLPALGRNKQACSERPSLPPRPETRSNL